jgi:hypothetical protein
VLAAVLVTAFAQQLPSETRASEGSSLNDLRRLAGKAHEAGHIDDEIAIRQRLNEAVWADYTRNPKLTNQYELYDHIFLNDLPLAVLLEGTHRFTEAEQLFRHNQAELASMKIAGNDIRSENELLLARLLSIEGKAEEANKICSHWKKRMGHLAAGQDSDHWHGTPRTPLYDTPEVETAAWDLACGGSDQGLRLLSEQIQVHPGMLAPYTVLGNYYVAEGDFQKALATEKEGATALAHRTSLR